MWEPAPAGEFLSVNPRQLFRAIDIESRFLAGDRLHTIPVCIDNRPRAAIAPQLEQCIKIHPGKDDGRTQRILESACDDRLWRLSPGLYEVFQVFCRNQWQVCKRKKNRVRALGNGTDAAGDRTRQPLLVILVNDEKTGERLGLTFLGRGFDTSIGVPFNEPLLKGLEKSASQCAEHCPTGALSFRKRPFRNSPRSL